MMPKNHGMVVSDASFDARKTQEKEINRYISPNNCRNPVANIVEVFSLYAKKNGICRGYICFLECIRSIAIKFASCVVKPTHSDNGTK